MNRHKFRAWDKDEKKWCNYQVYIDSNGEAYYEHYERGLDNNVNVEIMQYTGLKDKNGVEIYDGDIVHLTSDEGVNYNALIVFKNGGFCAIDGTESDYSFRRYDLSRFDLYLKVIGNVYQHLELLEVER